MRMSWTWLACGVALAAAQVYLAPTADARPPYNKEFWAAYPDLKNLLADDMKCNACHGKEKKVRNDYGKAVGEALGGSKITDVEKIKAALKTAEDKKSSVEGKTFGELIKEGKLPGKAE
jgi:hypothetical protein